MHIIPLILAVAACHTPPAPPEPEVARVAPAPTGPPQPVATGVVLVPQAVRVYDIYEAGDDGWRKALSKEASRSAEGDDRYGEGLLEAVGGVRAPGKIVYLSVREPLDVAAVDRVRQTLLRGGYSTQNVVLLDRRGQLRSVLLWPVATRDDGTVVEVSDRGFVVRTQSEEEVVIGCRDARLQPVDVCADISQYDWTTMAQRARPNNLRLGRGGRPMAGAAEAVVRVQADLPWDVAAQALAEPADTHVVLEVVRSEESGG